MSDTLCVHTSSVGRTHIATCATCAVLCKSCIEFSFFPPVLTINVCFNTGKLVHPIKSWPTSVYQVLSQETNFCGYRGQQECVKM